MATAHVHRVMRTARWWSLDPTPESAHGGVLYVLHGYGQLAEYFIRKFQAPCEAGWRVVAPEGAHRFYLKGTEGRVGASWMTREARLDDIRDYVGALDSLRQEIDPEHQGHQALLGFSQGVATALRWAALGQNGPASWDTLIAHSGVIPPDLNAMDGELKGAPDLHLISGNEDPYVTDPEGRFKTAEASWREAGGRTSGLHLHAFDGAHHIDPSTVTRLLREQVHREG